MDRRSVARGLALLLDRGTPTVEWKQLLDAEADLYSQGAIEMLEQMSKTEWLFVVAGRDPREISDTATELDWEIIGRYGLIGRMLESCGRDGVESAITAALDAHRHPPA